MTLDQSKTGAVLEALGFAMKPSGTPGSEPVYEITAQVVENLKAKQGKSIIVDGDGQLRIE